MFVKSQSYYLANTCVVMSDYKECGLERLKLLQSQSTSPFD